jgi:phospholipid transport system substrate-binding protein
MRAAEHRAGATRAVVVAVALLWGASLVAVAVADEARAAVPESSARDMVSKALAQVMEILNDAQLTPAVRRDRIADIAYRHFDFDTMSKLVVARPWRKFSPQQRSDFIGAFKTHLARSYGRRLGRYDNTKVKVVSEVAEPRGDVTVHSRVVGGQFDGAEMNYRVRGKTGEWLVIDVIIEGVSLVSNFRSQFKPILAQGGAPELLRRLEDKNDVLQAEIVVEDNSPESGQPVSTSAVAQ